MIDVNLVTAGSNYEEVAQKFQTAQRAARCPTSSCSRTCGGSATSCSTRSSRWATYSRRPSVETADYRAGLSPTTSTRRRSGPSRGRARRRCSTTIRRTGRRPASPTGRPKTWDEFASWAPKLKAASTGRAGGVRAPGAHRLRGLDPAEPLVGRTAPAGRPRTRSTSRATPTRP